MYDTLVDVIKASFSDDEATSVGVVAKDIGEGAIKGDFALKWIARLAKSQESIDVKDVAAAFGGVLGVKDAVEVSNMKKAALLSCRFLSEAFKPEMLNIIDSSKKVRHSKVTAHLEDAFTDPEKSIRAQVKADLVESCYSPIVQSGADCDLKASAQSNDKFIVGAGSIMCSLGARYRLYCSNIARTYFVDPTDEQEEVYRLLLAVYDECVTAMRVGKPIKDVMEKAQAFIARKNPSLSKHFVKVPLFAPNLNYYYLLCCSTPSPFTICCLPLKLAVSVCS